MTCSACGCMIMETYEKAGYLVFESGGGKCGSLANKPESASEMYVLVTWNDVEPEILSPFETEEERLLAAVGIRAWDEGKVHGVYWLDMEPGSMPQTSWFSGEESLDDLADAVRDQKIPCRCGHEIEDHGDEGKCEFVGCGCELYVPARMPAVGEDGA